MRVADNGLGLTERGPGPHLRALRARRSATCPGTGMGLAVARRMLERLGGTILAALRRPRPRLASSPCWCRCPARLTASSAAACAAASNPRPSRGSGRRRRPAPPLGLLVGEDEDRAAGRSVRAQHARDLRGRPARASRGRARRRRARARARGQRLGAVGRLADELEAGMRGDRTPQQPPDQLVVVGQQDAGGGGSADTFGRVSPDWSVRVLDQRGMAELATSGFELRFDLAGRAAVRVEGGPVAPRHVEPVPPRAPWVAEARCGDAVGWLLANAAPRGPGGGAGRCSPARRARGRAAPAGARRGRCAPLAAELLERLTHRLRTDVTTLQAVADGALAGLFEPADLELLPGELQRTGREALRAAQRRARGDGRARRARRGRRSRRRRRCGRARSRRARGDRQRPARRAAADVHPRPRLGGVRADACRRPAAGDVRRRTRPGGWCVISGADGDAGRVDRTNGRRAGARRPDSSLRRAVRRSRRTRSGCD